MNQLLNRLYLEQTLYRLKAGSMTVWSEYGRGKTIVRLRSNDVAISTRLRYKNFGGQEGVF